MTFMNRHKSPGRIYIILTLFYIFCRIFNIEPQYRSNVYCAFVLIAITCNDLMNSRSNVSVSTISVIRK